MIKSLEITKLYFELSNKSDFNGIQNLFTDSTTYSSPTTGIYLGRDNIMAMQRGYRSKFSSLNWKVNSAEEIKPGVVLFDYEFNGVKDGENIKNSGLEYVIVYQGKIQHIEVRNKPGA